MTENLLLKQLSTLKNKNEPQIELNHNTLALKMIMDGWSNLCPLRLLIGIKRFVKLECRLETEVAKLGGEQKVFPISLDKSIITSNAYNIIAKTNYKSIT